MEIITSPPQPTNQPPSPATSSNSNAAQTPPLTPPPVSRSDPHPHPTTFVQADTTSFKQVVQMLTGSSNPTHHPDPTPTPSKSTSSIPPVKTGQQKKYKLYERRNSLKTGLMINPSHSGHGLSSPRVHELLSPSILDFPALTLSPVTPLIQDRFNSNNNDNNNKSSPSVSEEERVIKEKGFYLHPSPRAASPQLLPLFPVASPRASELSS
ncbi:putative VQ motif-containing protein/13/19/31/33 [Helianthus annuus]|nr:putative VQ motif-containing protein/13/19/31/33 [Helianthus annuus]